MQGKFISFEGCDGSGKSTQVSLATRALKEMGLDFWQTREPGGTDISEKIRRMILDNNNEEMVWKTEALLYAASRSQLMDEKIRKFLSQGKMVICDRFTDSTMAYQGYGRQLDKKSLEMLNDFATAGLKPDLTILLDIDPEIAFRRRKDQKKDRLEGENILFHKRVRQGYLELAEAEPERFFVLSATQDRMILHEKIMEKIQAILQF